MAEQEIEKSTSEHPNPENPAPQTSAQAGTASQATDAPNAIELEEIRRQLRVEQILVRTLLGLLHRIDPFGNEIQEALNRAEGREDDKRSARQIIDSVFKAS